jgi:membrane fusion protein (multidrug efflux system)
LWIVAAIVLIAGSGWLAYYLLVARWHQQTDDAYAQGNIVNITPQTPGTVIAISVDAGMRVLAGQALVQLDASDAEIAYQQALANLAGSVRQVRGFYSSVDTAQAELTARRVAVAQARADVARRSGLVATGAVSAEELAHARAELQAAEAALSASQGQLSRSRALVDATVVAGQPQVQAAAAQVRQAYLAVRRAAIVSPIDGYVGERSVQLGQRVQPGTPLMTVIPLHEVWVEANFKETQLLNMRLGQPVKLTADVYGDDVVFDGKLVSLGLGTGSAFSLLPAQNASGNWIKIVQRIPTRIALDPQQLTAHPLRLGMSMSVDVDVRDQSGPVLPAAAKGKLLQTTTAYDKQLQDANAVIEQTIKDNLARTSGA